MIQDPDARKDALIAYWPFDEPSGNSAEDRAGETVDPIDYVFKEARFTESRSPLRKAGIKGRALLFDGYSTWVSKRGGRLSAPLDAVTITVWVAPRSFGGEGELSAIVSRHDREKKQGFLLGIGRHGSCSLQLGFGKRWEEIHSGEARLTKNQWSFLAATYDKGSGEMKLYLNGAEVAARRATAGAAIIPADAELLLGKSNRPVVLAGAFLLYLFNGLMDEVKLYGRALRPEEIAAAYAEDLLPYGGERPDIPEEELLLDREPLLKDRHRPQYHLSPPACWMNEPHAPIYYEGHYHLFYQHNPQGPYWHHIHWGHWVSKDLVHWKDLPIALSPDSGGVCPDGVWSGSAAYDPNGVPALFFTAGDDRCTPNQRVGLATSAFLQDGDPNLVRWTADREPLILQPEGLGLSEDFRDPFVWKEGDSWYLLIGSGYRKGGGTVLAYRSEDMKSWEYCGPFYAADHEKFPSLGTIWELPVLLPLGADKQGKEKHLFLVSPLGPGADVEVFYWIGTFDRDKVAFRPDREEPQLIDVGDFHFTGPSGMVDPPTGRKILFTIAQGERTPELDYRSGWAHNGGLPLSVYLREDGRLGIEPVRELESLRGEKLASFQDKPLEEANALLSDVRGDMLEIRVELAAAEAKKLGVKVRRSPGEEEETLLFYDREASTLGVDRTRTTLSAEERSKGIQGGELELRGDNLKLLIYLDRSMIEAYANGLKSLTTRAYPTREDALGVQIWGDDPSLIVRSMEIWRMKSAW